MRRLLLAWGPWRATPVGELRWYGAIHPLPPGFTMWSDRDIGENRILPNRHHHVGISFRARARSDAEEASLGVDGPQTAVRALLHPGNILPHGPHLIPQVLQRGHQHGEAGLAAGTR